MLNIYVYIQQVHYGICLGIIQASAAAAFAIAASAPSCQMTYKRH